MKLHSPEFEAVLKRKVMAEIYSDSSARREFQRVKSYKRLHRTWPIQVPICLLLPLITLGFWNTTNDLDSCLLAINMWLVCSILLFQSHLSQIPFTSIELRNFPYYPIDGNKICLWELDRALKLSVLILVHCLLGYSVLAYLFNFTSELWLMIIISVVSWVGCVLISFLLSARITVPSYFAPLVTLFLGFSALLLLLIIRSDTPSPLFPHNSLPATALNLYLPTGWVVSMVHTVLGDDRASWGLLVIPLFVLGALDLKRSLASFKTRLEYHEIKASPSLDIIPGLEKVNRKLQAVRELHLGEAAIEQGIVSGEFTLQTEWHAGLDGWAWKSLSAHQRNLAEFAFSYPPRILSRWKWVFGPLLLFIFLSFLSISANSNLAIWLWSCGLVFSFPVLLVILFNSGAMYLSKYGNECFIPNHAFFPISYWNMLLFLIKIAAVQIPFICVYAMILVCFSSYLFAFDFANVSLLIIQIITSFLCISTLYHNFLFDYLYSPNFFIVRWTKMANVLLFCLSGFIAMIFPLFVFGKPDGLCLQIACPLCTLACPLLQSVTQSLYYRDNKVDSICLVDPSALYRARRNGYYGKS